MKLKDIDNLIKSYNKYNKLINSNNRYVLKMNAWECRDKDFKSVNEFIKYFNDNFYGVIDMNTKIDNASGGTLEFTTTHYDYFYKKDIEVIYFIYLEVINEY